MSFTKSFFFFFFKGHEGLGTSQCLNAASHMEWDVFDAALLEKRIKIDIYSND